MGVTLRWGPTGLTHVDALTKDKAEAADLLKACVRAYHPRCNGLEKSMKPSPLRKLMVKFEITADERLTRTLLKGLTDVEATESSTTAAEGRMRVSFPAKTVLTNLPLKQEKSKGDTAARGEHGKPPGPDCGVSGGQNLAYAGGLGERLRKKLMRGELHVDMQNPYSPAIRHFRGLFMTCPNTNSQVPDCHEYNEAITAVADDAPKMLEIFPRERSRLLSLLSRELGWRSWSNDDEDWTRSAT